MGVFETSCKKLSEMKLLILIIFCRLLSFSVATWSPARKKRDSIAQNRLGNNLHIWKVGKERETKEVSFEYQLFQWLSMSKRIAEIRKMTNPLTERLQKKRMVSKRLKLFRGHHHKK